MTDTLEKQLIALTQDLLDAITGGDWETYEQLCDPMLSAFEPEACGHQVIGMDFHRYYFELERKNSPAQTTITAPHVRRLGSDAAVVSYVRLIQRLDDNGKPQTASFEETRVWERHGPHGHWRHVHFHRSPA